MELRVRRQARLNRLAALAAALVVVALAALAGAAPSSAQAETEPEQPPSQTEPPPGYDLNARRAIRLAARSEVVRAERPAHDDFRPTAYTRGPGRWQVSWFDGDREVAQVRLDDSTGAVLEAWTGDQVAWTMARGYEGAFGRKLNAPYIWLPLCALFLLPFVDPRRPLRMVHLDLLVLLGFGASHFFFNRGEIGVSVPLVYPVLAYLLARLLWVGSRAPPSRLGRALVPLLPISWLAFALVFLVAFRVGLNVIDSNVIDVGYAGVIGADRIADGDPLYGAGFHADVEHGDTYGPFTYLAYVPFEQVMPWSGEWDGLPAARGAALAFDLLTLVGLWLLGRRLRPGQAGRDLGIVLAYAWATYPYAMFALQSNANDTLLGLMTVVALLALTLAPARRGASAVARGGAIGLGTAAKFGALALAPLFATADPGGERRTCVGLALVFALALVCALVATFAPFVPDGGLREIYDRTVGYQDGRGSPFSIWGQLDVGEAARRAVAIAAALLALAVALFPRRKQPLQVAALGAAVLIGAQLAVSHWFYLYVVWFAPLALVALLGRQPLTAADVPQPAEPRAEPIVTAPPAPAAAGSP